MATTNATISTERIYRAEGLRLSAFLCEETTMTMMLRVCAVSELGPGKRLWMPF